MLAILPLIALILGWLILHRSGQDWRGTTLATAVSFGTGVVVITEGLSYLQLLRFPAIVAGWILIVIALAGTYYDQMRQGKRVPHLLHWSKLPPLLWVLLGGVIGLGLITGVTAVVAPPNNWDSMTYHMSRLVHWIQNHSLAHYPTYNLPQLFHPPFNSIVILHLQVLSGSDRWANLVQWFSMVGSVIGVSLIAKQLGAELTGQVWAAVFCATLPMGILQSSSTQNDYVVCFWLVCLVHYLLRGLTQPHPPTYLLGLGASLGLATLTKTSGYIYALPLLTWFFGVKLYRLRWRVWQPLVVVTVIFLSFNVHHYWRNFTLFGSPLPTPSPFDKDYKIEIYSLPTFLSNVIRNLSLHVDIIRYLKLDGIITPLTGKVQKLVDFLHQVLGVDPTDPRITAGKYTVPSISFDENVANNPLHFLLIGVAIALLLARKPLRGQQRLSYLAAVVGCFLLLCLVLKMQPYQSRHHLAFFVLLAPLVAIALTQTWNRAIVSCLAVVLIVTCLPWSLQNEIRPILAEKTIFNTSRTELYFMARPQLQAPYERAVNWLKAQNCADVGLSFGTGKTVGNQYWEYPFWPLLQQSGLSPFRLEHLQPENLSDQQSAAEPYRSFQPCAVVSLRQGAETQPDTLNLPQGTFTRAWTQGPVTIMTRTNP